MAADATAVEEAVAAEKAALEAREEKRRMDEEAAQKEISPESPPAVPMTAVPAPATDMTPSVTSSGETHAMPAGSVGRAAFTTIVRDREPQDDIKTLGNDVTEISFFTELNDMTGQTAIHRWEYQGDVMAEVSFNVGGPRWRVWSRKSLLPQWLGTWKVSVVNGAGEVVHEQTFEYVPAAPADGQ
jgi:hypothetical protein